MNFWSEKFAIFEEYSKKALDDICSVTLDLLAKEDLLIENQKNVSGNKENKKKNNNLEEEEDDLFFNLHKDDDDDEELTSSGQSKTNISNIRKEMEIFV